MRLKRICSMLKREKKLFIIIAFAVVVWGVIYSDGTVAEASGEYLDVDPVRIHIIANSDRAIDQTAKLAVRDAVVKKISPLVADLNTQEEAVAVIKPLIPELVTIAEDVVGDLGYGARAEFGVFEFPDRNYGEQFYPAGDYLALRLILGEGKGKNWWCVLFPPLCFVDDVMEASEKENEAISTMTGENMTEKGDNGIKVEWKLEKMLN